MNTIESGLRHIGEAYQTSFDNLREEIYAKNIGLSRRDSILLTDFIQTHSLNEQVALANINKDTADPLIKCLKKAEALSDICLRKNDVIILNKIINNPIFDDNNLKNIIKYASGSGSLNRDVISIRSSCAYFEEELRNAVRDCLTHVRGD